MLSPLTQSGREDTRKRRAVLPLLLVLLLGISPLLFLSCKQLSDSQAGSLYSEAIPPRKQEFRWSNGKAPKSLDPALAAAPPETDIVRAIYEGLTDLDPKTLREVPAVAEKWTSSDGDRTWTFQLRKNAKWSNGDAVTAQDFVRSWKRLDDMGESVSHRELLSNIAGMHLRTEEPPTPGGASDPVPSPVSDKDPLNQFSPLKNQLQKDKPGPAQSSAPEKSGVESLKNSKQEVKFGVEAVSDLVLRVTLVSPDKDLPRLVAHPLFRPVFGDGKYLTINGLDPAIITNGPFRLSSAGADGVVVTRSEQYWDAGKVKLESIRFVPEQSAEKALAAYRSGDLDAVTNAELEPLALKLLSPYADFRQATHNALNFYEFNMARPPFSDRRVRQALSIGIDRDRLTEGEMKGSTEPALHFLPYDTNVNDSLLQDAEQAKKLLEDAGFPNGENFPTIHLVVNRNETQLRIARSVVKMWKQNLNLNAEIVTKEPGDIDSVRSSGDFDIVRRGVVFPTMDRTASFTALFPQDRKAEMPAPDPRQNQSQLGVKERHGDKAAGGPNITDDPSLEQSSDVHEYDANLDGAIYDFRLIPLYFPMSYGLVKPYVQGFDVNGLDSPSVKNIRIDSDWQPKQSVPGS